MRVLKLTTATGPTVFHTQPVIMMTLDLEALSETDSTRLPGFVDRLLRHLPGLKAHRCSPGYEGGFVERLHRGTYLAHIIEHVALEMSTLAGIEVGYGKTVYAGVSNVYKIAVRYRNEEGMRFLLRSAVEWVQAAVDGKSDEELARVLDERIAEAKILIARSKLGPSTQAIIDAAERRQIPWMRLNELNLIQLGYGKNRKWIQATTSSLTSDIAVDIAQDKEMTKALLKRHGVRVPDGGSVESADEAVLLFRELQEDGARAVVVKPLDGNHGRGVSLSLQDEAAVRRAFEEAYRISSQVIVEEQLFGNDYRIVLVGGKVVAASRRVPAHIVGDGVHRVRELIEIENRNPLRGESHDRPLTRLSGETKPESFLNRIPFQGEFVAVCDTANLSTGGTAIDITDELHSSIRKICERSARVIGLDICGIDLIAEDASMPLDDQNGGVIEVNAGPGIRMHHHPSEGRPRDVGGAIVDFLYPHPDLARIPIVSVTGTNGKTTVTRLIEHLFFQNGYTTGTTQTDGVFINRERIAEGDTTGPESAQLVLSDPAVEIAILETARGGITKRGLGYDRSDVGVITNVTADHIGQDGIETVADVLKIKAVVADAVRPGGTVVLNADDRTLRAFSESAEFLKGGDRKLAFFSLDAESEWLSKKTMQGHACYSITGNYLWEAKNAIVTQVMKVSEIPLSLGGSARFQLANVLAALAAVRALDMGVQEFVTGVRSFHPFANPGRTNLYRLGHGYLLIDYGHNPEAFRAIAQTVSRWNVDRVTAVIAAPGDRADDLIRLSGMTAAEEFGRILIREDDDLRGRKPGEVAKLLRDAAYEADPDVECAVELSYEKALERAVNEMIPDELVVFFYEDSKSLRALLGRYPVIPIQDFRPLLSQKVPHPASHPASHSKVNGWRAHW